MKWVQYSVIKLCDSKFQVNNSFAGLSGKIFNGMHNNHYCPVKITYRP